MPSTNAAKPELIIFDHDPSTTRMLGYLFETNGYSVRKTEVAGPDGTTESTFHFSNANEAITHIAGLHKAPAGLVVDYAAGSDIPADQPSGAVIVAEARKKFPGIPVVMISRHNSTKPDIALRAAGVDPASVTRVDKPFTSTEGLVETVNRALSTQPIAVLANDNKFQTMIQKRLLEDIGFDVRTAPTAQSALEIFKNLHNIRPSVLLTDYNMSGHDSAENGAWLAAEARKIIPDLPVVIHSGTPRDDIQDALTAQGLAEGETLRILEKPADIGAIQEAVRSVMNSALATPGPEARINKGSIELKR